MNGKGAAVLGLGLLLICWGFPAPQARAACGDRASGAADVYKVTVNKIEFSEDGTTFITVFDGSRQIDISAVDAGAVAAGLVSGAAVPPATYTQVRVTVGSTLKVRGYINIAGSTHYTDGGTDSGAFGLNAGVTDTPGGDCAESTFTIPAANRTSTGNVTFTVPEGGAAPTVRVAFDTSGVITNNGGAPSLGPPTITMSAN